MNRKARIPIGEGRQTKTPAKPVRWLCLSPPCFRVKLSFVSGPLFFGAYSEAALARRRVAEDIAAGDCDGRGRVNMRHPESLPLALVAGSKKENRPSPSGDQTSQGTEQKG